MKRKAYEAHSITDRNNIALWSSGHYNGQRDNTVLNVSALQENLEKLEKLKDYCITSPIVPVIQTVEANLAKP